MEKKINITTIVYLFFFLSGMTGLIYEIVWVRLITLIMGGSTLSITTVLAAFMGGLGLGSYLAGRFIDRRTDALKIYGLMEGLIGIYCVLLPHILDAMKPLYQYFYQNWYSSFYTFSLFRFLVSAVILLIPTILMGATLPVLSKYFVRKYKKIGSTIGRVYAVNTFGAVLGAFATGFFLIPALGVKMTIYGAASVNIVIAVSVYVLYYRTREPVPSVHPEKKILKEVLSKEIIPFFAVLVLITIGISGFVSMVYQICWTRIFTMTIGSSTYAFSLIVTAFILGIGLGSIVFSQFIDRLKDQILNFSIIELVIGLSGLVLIPILGNLPLYTLRIYLDYTSSFTHLQFIVFAIIFVIMLIPTIMMGASFPVAAKIYTKSVENIGRSVGVVYAFNTFGAILGSFSAGFILMPWIGLQNSLIAGVLMNLTLGCVLLFYSSLFKNKKRFIIPAFLMIFGICSCAWLPPWSENVLSSGPFINANSNRISAYYKKTDIVEYIKTSNELIYYKEGVNTTVSVGKAANGDLYLAVNGKTDASTSADLSTQMLIAHIPLLMHPDADDVCLIGLGSGITLGSIECYPVKHIDCAEISPAVVEGARLFKDFNNNAHEDPRVQFIIEDGRNHLTWTDRSYDIIISQPSNPWIAGIGNLFTREYFELCKSKLKDDGIICVWAQAYSMTPENFKMMVRTFQLVFPQMYLWETGFGVDYVMIGMKEDIPFDYLIMQNNFLQTKVKKNLEKIGLKSLPAVLSNFYLGYGEFNEYVGDGPIIADDNAILEFNAPRSLYENTSIDQIKSLEPYRKIPTDYLSNLSGNPAAVNLIKEDIDRLFKAKLLASKGKLYELKSEFDNAREEYKKVLQLNPDEREINLTVNNQLSREVGLFMANKEYEKAIEKNKKWIYYNPNSYEPYKSLGMIYMIKEEPDKALAQFAKALELKREEAELYYIASQAYLGMDKIDHAILMLVNTIKIDSTFSSAYFDLSGLLRKKDLFDQAIPIILEYIELEPDDPEGYVELGILYNEIGMINESMFVSRQALELYPDNGAIYYNVAASYFYRAEYDSSRKYCSVAENLGYDVKLLREELENPTLPDSSFLPGSE